MVNYLLSENKDISHSKLGTITHTNTYTQNKQINKYINKNYLTPIVMNWNWKTEKNALI